jgi:hypothetical protein
MVIFSLRRIRRRQKQKGRDYSRSLTGTGVPTQERFRHARVRACFERRPVFEIASFVRDSG